MAQPDPPETASAAGASLKTVSELLTSPNTRLASNDSLGRRQHRQSVRLGKIGDRPGTGRELIGKKRSLRRPKTNWSSSVEYADEDDQRNDGKNNAFEGDMEDSHVHPIDNETLSFWNRMPVKARASGNVGGAGIELDDIRELNSRDMKCDCSSADGVGEWLTGLGLRRYVTVFEIHEVDDEVLPLLTLEDLKDMGIKAVGSRRKMYTAIQKLRKGFSRD